MELGDSTAWQMLNAETNPVPSPCSWQELYRNWGAAVRWSPAAPSRWDLLGPSPALRRSLGFKLDDRQRAGAEVGVLRPRSPGPPWVLKVVPQLNSSQSGAAGGASEQNQCSCSQTVRPAVSRHPSDEVTPRSGVVTEINISQRWHKHFSYAKMFSARKCYGTCLQKTTLRFSWPALFPTANHPGRHGRLLARPSTALPLCRLPGNV